MKYKTALKLAMENLAKDEKVRFLGYNVKYGSKGYGTLEEVSQKQLIETPLAENLMTDLAIGLAIEGFKPVVFFERHDFMLNAMDSIVNHLGKLEKLSYGEFKSPMIIRAAVGSTKPLYPGLQHMQDFTKIFRDVLEFEVQDLQTSKEILEKYEEASAFTKPVMLVERRDLYEKDDLKRAALIFPINKKKKVLLQLRDNKPGIACPGIWGCLGGSVEEGETPLAGIKRELNEEIGYELDNIEFLEESKLEKEKLDLFFYRGEIDKEIEDITLNEGQRIEYFYFEEAIKLEAHRSLIDFLVKNKDKLFR